MRGLLVNTTTLGMHGQPDLAIDVGRLPGHAIVADLVYVPLVTPLLRAATARNLRTADGLGMLLHQAVRGFLLWFGKRPEVTAELRALLEADLRRLNREKRRNKSRHARGFNPCWDDSRAWKRREDDNDDT